MHWQPMHTPSTIFWLVFDVCEKCPPSWLGPPCDLRNTIQPIIGRIHEYGAQSTHWVVCRWVIALQATYTLVTFGHFRSVDARLPPIHWHTVFERLAWLTFTIRWFIQRSVNLCMVQYSFYQIRNKSDTFFCAR